MKDRSKSQIVIISILVLTILSVNGFQIKLAFSQDEETPDFGGTKAPFVPLPEEGRSPPPPPGNATVVKDLPKNLFVRDNDTDREPLAITNKTELLEVLPANATGAIEFIDKSLKNSTGQGLLPPGVLSNVSASAQLDNASSATDKNRNFTSILDVLNKENLTQKILSLISPANKSVTSADLEEIEEPQPPKAIENATSPVEQSGNETGTSISGSDNTDLTHGNETNTEQNPIKEIQPPIKESDELPPNDNGSSEPQDNTPVILANNTANETANNTEDGSQDNPPMRLANNTEDGSQDNPPMRLANNTDDEPT